MKKFILLMVCTCFTTLSFISCSDSDKDKVPEELTKWFWRLDAYAYQDTNPQSAIKVDWMKENYTLTLYSDGKMEAKCLDHQVSGRFSVSGNKIRFYDIKGIVENNTDKPGHYFESHLKDVYTYKTEGYYLKLYYSDNDCLYFITGFLK